MNDILETMTQVSRLEQHSTKVGLSQFVTVTQPKFCVWKVLVKCGRSMMCVCVRACMRSKMMFLTYHCQVRTPKILKLEFPMQTWGPKQKCKWNKLKIIKNFKLTPCTTESSFELKYLWFIPDTMQSISFFHYLWFTRCKCLLSNMQTI